MTLHNMRIFLTRPAILACDVKDTQFTLIALSGHQLNVTAHGGNLIQYNVRMIQPLQPVP